MKTFAIDFVRQLIRQTLLQENFDNPDTYIGNEEQLSLVSFYEHLASDEEVDRFVETIRDLTNQENRTNLIANGIIIAPTNPTITNLNQCTIIPMDFNVSFRCTLADRDLVLESLDNMVSILKGRKWDIAEFDNGQLMVVKTIANNSSGEPIIPYGAYIGDFTDSEDTLTTFIEDIIADLGFTLETITDTPYFYYEEDGVLKVATYDSDDSEWVETEDDYENYPHIIFPPEHSAFTKYCLSISFDSQRCSEPRTLNAEDYCEVSFGGSATLVSASVMLGNQLTKLGIARYAIITQDNQTISTPIDSEYSWVEPLEIPSSNNADTQINQLISNSFVNNSHTNNITISNQYTFIIDEDIDLIKQFFKYAKYGTQSYITPNTIYEIVEIYSKWGNVETNTFYAKVVESIDIENTESDTMTITIPFQIQGENN